MLGAGHLDRRVPQVERSLKDWLDEKNWGQLYLEYTPVTPNDQLLVEDLAVMMLINSRAGAQAATSVCL